MGSSEARLPNILFITADQWRSDLIDLARSVGLEFPNIERLARAGTRFAEHYTQAYPCGPARASLNTGLYAHKHRSIQNGTPLDACHRTLFQEVRRAGYRPYLFGYTDTTLDPRNLDPHDPDRHTYEGVAPGLAVETGLAERATAWLAHLKHKGYAIADPDRGRVGVFAMAPFGAPTIFPASDSEATFLTDRFLEWLAVQGVAPWFAHLSYISPHPPFGVGEPFFSKIAKLAPAGYGNTTPMTADTDQHPLLTCMVEHTRIEGFFPSLDGLVRDQPEDVRQRIRAIYLGQALEIDFHIGRIIDALSDYGAWDKTAIVFTSDHGEQLFDHGLLGKLGYFDQSAHIPLIVRDPRPVAEAGRARVVEEFSEAVDVMPTILAMMGLRAPRNCDGVSLVPFCAGITPATWRDEVHWSFDFREMAAALGEYDLHIPSEWCNLQVVRTKRLKYVHFAALAPLLFDLAEDPGEMVNRARTPFAAALQMEGMSRMLTWRQRSEERTLSGFLATSSESAEDPQIME